LALGIEEADVRPPSSLGGSGGDGGVGGVGGVSEGGGGEAGSIPWFDEDYPSRKRVTLDTTVSDEDIAGITLAVALTDAELSAAGYPDGRDLVFTADDAVTRLPHELQVFEQSTGVMLAWVRLPLVQALTATEIYLYFGNADVADQQDVAATWPADPYRGVWHLDEDPLGPAEPILDSSVHGNGGTTLGDPMLVAGVAAGAIDFDGDLDRVVIDDDDQALDFGLTSYSFSVWTLVTEYTDAGDVLLFKGTGQVGWQLDLVPSQQFWRAALFDVDTDSSSFGPDDQFLNVWTHLVGVVDRDTGNLQAFAQGTFRNQTAMLLTGSMDTNQPLLLSPGGNPCTGIIDEVRVYGRVLRPAEIALEHHNLDPGVTFATASAAESRP
jgi:Concanavalin A-like lectin/glucanases superfamily/Domain of unknown function (DUF2341)